MRNPILATDSYKLTHHAMYPQGTSQIYSYFESREGSKYPYTVLFGLKGIISKIFQNPVTMEHIAEAEAFSVKHFGKNYINRHVWEVVVKEYGGFPPLEITAIDEGNVVNTGIPLLTITNTDPRCSSLVNHYETLLSHYWYPCNVATISFYVKTMINRYAKKCGYKGTLNYFLHDFGYRGASCEEAAAIGGAAHLTSFDGTDTIAAHTFIKDYYNSDFVGASVPASEHSVMTILGKEGEMSAVGRILKNYPDGIVSVVSDSFNIYDACQYYVSNLKDQILARNGKFVVRPDSGDAVEVIIKCLNILSAFGVETNEKGYKRLNPKVGLIWGDGLNVDKIQEIIEKLDEKKWCISNVVFGMGGGLLQNHNRDTQRFAIKASSSIVDGFTRSVSKNPLHGSKKSKSGRFIVYEHGKKFLYTDENSTARTCLHPVYGNLSDNPFNYGIIPSNMDFESIRSIVNYYLDYYSDSSNLWI